MISVNFCKISVSVPIRVIRGKIPKIEKLKLQNSILLRG